MLTLEKFLEEFCYKIMEPFIFTVWNKGTEMKINEKLSALETGKVKPSVSYEGHGIVRFRFKMGYDFILVTISPSNYSYPI